MHSSIATYIPSNSLLSCFFRIYKFKLSYLRYLEVVQIEEMRERWIPKRLELAEVTIEAEATIVDTEVVAIIGVIVVDTIKAVAMDMEAMVEEVPVVVAGVSVITEVEVFMSVYCTIHASCCYF